MDIKNHDELSEAVFSSFRTGALLTATSRESLYTTTPRHSLNHGHIAQHNVDYANFLGIVGTHKQT